MRNAVAIVLAVAMLATAAVVALDVATLLEAGPHVAAPGRDDAGSAQRERIVAAFYAEANRVLAGEPVEAVHGVVSAAVVTHPATGEPLRGADDLAEYFGGLRQQGHVAVSLELKRVVDNGLEVAAFVEARSAGDPDQGASHRTLLWRTIDLFRIEGARITDYWPGAAGPTAPAPLAAATIPAAPGDAGASLTRIVLGPDAEEVTLRAPQPHLLLVESGAIAASRETALHVALVGEREFTLVPAEPDEEVILRPGDALLMTDGTGPTIRNPGEDAASALSLLIAPRARLYSQVRALPTDTVTVMGIHDPSRIGQEMAWRSGAASETLAVGMLSGGWQAEAVALHGEPLMLDPGQRLAPVPTGSLRLAIVRSGTASITRFGGFRELSRRSAQPPIPKQASLYWPGDALTLAGDEAATIANAGTDRLDLLLVEIVPSDGETPASPTTR